LDFNSVSDGELPLLPSDKPAFLSAKVPPSGIPLIHSLETSGFMLVDANLVLNIKKMNKEKSSITRLARAEDEAAVRKIAASSLRLSRFHNDPAITEKTADNIKEEWAGNYFKGERGDCLIVTERQNEVAGFLLAIENNGNAFIDLIAVDQRYRNQGCGREMINYLWNHSGLKMASLSVGTQIANTISLYFYQSLGFRLSTSSYIFHKHVQEKQ
jgi:ribosomal protein S18 acetylase RimI-like enzyme